MPPKKANAAAPPSGEAEVEQPKDPEPEIGMTLDRAREFYLIQDRNEYKNFFEKILQKSETELSARETITLDYHVLNMSGFSAEQAVHIFGAFDKLMSALRLTPERPEEEYLQILKDSLLDSSKQKGLSGSPLLTLPDVKRIVSYALSSLFNHLDLYRYVYSIEQDSTERTIGVFVETPMPWNQALDSSFPSKEEADQAIAMSEEAREESAPATETARNDEEEAEKKVEDAETEKEELQEETQVETADGPVPLSKLEDQIQKAIQQGIDLAKTELRTHTGSS